MENTFIHCLSQSTKVKLAPLKNLYKTDYLEIWLTQDKGDFICRWLSCSPPDILQRHHLWRMRTPDPYSSRREVEIKTHTSYTGEFLVQDEGTHWVSYDARQLFRRIPESFFDRYHPENVTCAGTDFTVLLIHHLVPKDRLIFRGEESRLLYEFLLYRFMGQTRKAEIQARFKEQGAIPSNGLKYFIEHPRNPLSAYQKVGLHLITQQNGALFMDRGTGKTAVAVSKIARESHKKFAEEGKMFRALIICPNQVRLNWKRELNKFSTVSGKACILRGEKFKRMKLLAHALKTSKDCAFSAIIAGYDTCTSEIDLLERVQWDLIVADESHFFKSNRTLRYETMIRLREASLERAILTGTPLGNTLFDLFTQLEFLDKGMSGFKTFTGFKRFHGRYVSQYEGVNGTGSSVQRLCGFNNVPLLQERLSRVSFRITKEDAGLELPEKIYDTFEVEMGAKQEAIYRSMAKAMAVEFEGELEASENKYMTANHILTKLLRLAQICSGYVTIDEEIDPHTGLIITPKSIQWIEETPSKILALKELLMDDEERDPKGKAIIWACFVPDILKISKSLTEWGIKHETYYGATPDQKRDAIVDRFNNDPEYKVLVCNAATAGEGLNLLGYNVENPDAVDTYADWEIWYSVNWSFILRSQGEDRAHRRGTRCQVRITDLTIPNTIDEEIRERVAGKKQMSENVFDIKEILANILESIS